MAVQALLGVIVRVVVALVRKDRGYLPTIRSRDWLIDTTRLVIAAALVVFTYGWIKLVVPVYHPTLFDQQLWNLDQTIGFGLAPTVFFLDLLGNARVPADDRLVVREHLLRQHGRRLGVLFLGAAAARPGGVRERVCGAGDLDGIAVDDEGEGVLEGDLQLNLFSKRTHC
jgi:hypothetical protein